MADSSALPKGNGKTILVVEDDDLVLNSLKLMLEILEYTPITEQNPAAAIDIALQNEDIVGVVSDVIMPGISGHDMWRKLLAQGRRLPTLFLSGYIKSDFPLREHDVRLIKKPVEIEQLAMSLEELLSGQC